jgi:hypothetical protein
MQEQGTRGYDTTVNVPLVEDRVIDAAPGAVIAPERPYAYAPYPDIRVGENVMTVRDRVQWGPIVAGLATMIGTLVILTVLGIAVGASVLDRNAPGEEIGTAAAVWGAVGAAVAFFLGGVVAAKSAAVAGPGTGVLNGLMVGFAAIALILLLTGIGLGNLFGWFGGNFDDIATAVLNTAGVDEAGDVAQAAVDEQEFRASFDEVEDGAWWTLAGLALALGAAALGGLVAHNTRRDLLLGEGVN